MMIHSLCQTELSDTEYQLHESPPPANSVVDTAIELFARHLPLQGLTATIKIITQLLESVRSPKLEKNAGRKSTVFINATIALVLALGNATVSYFRNVISSWLHQTVIHDQSAWIDLCQRIMARTTASQRVADSATSQNALDDEGESLNAGLSQESKADDAWAPYLSMAYTTFYSRMPP
jgi:hypothetical protein